MSVGTRSLFFGVHHFILHPLLVIIAWTRCYRAAPDARTVVAILLHDIGYLGCRDMNGQDGLRHPLLGARLAYHLLGSSYAQLVACHSADCAAAINQPKSKLWLPDKVATLFYPKWLYLRLARLSGEIYYYKGDMNLAHLDDAEWLNVLRRKTLRFAVREGVSCRLRRPRQAARQTSTSSAAFRGIAMRKATLQCG